MTLKVTCGPVGNCTAVQQSPKTYLIGFISLGIVDVAGYSAIILS
jgi:uncharacterized membrane protein